MAERVRQIVSEALQKGLLPPEGSGSTKFALDSYALSKVGGRILLQSQGQFRPVRRFGDLERRICDTRAEIELMLKAELFGRLMAGRKGERKARRIGGLM